MNILHINCNYTGNSVHRTMIKNLEKIDNLENYVFAPVRYKSIYEKQNDKVKISECFYFLDRLFFHLKSRKIRKSLLSSYEISKFDILHAYTLFTDGNVAWKINKDYNIPYVVAIRNTDVNTFFKYMIHLRKKGIEIMNNASAIFFLSPVYKKEVFDKYVPNNLKEKLDKKSYIIPNGIDDYWFEGNILPQNIDLNNINAIYAGRIDKNKNITKTQEALQQLRKKGYNINFSIVGKIENKNIFKKIMKYPNTKYYGEKKKEELKELYNKNDIFVMPSKKETFGLVYAEAMSQGLPVIYTKGQGFDGQFDEGKVGYHIIYKDAKDIADKILLIIQNQKDLLINCIKKSKKFKWIIIVYKYYEVYNSILDNRKKGKK